MPRRPLLALALLVVVATPWPAAGAGTSGAAAFVSGLVDAALAVLTDGGLDEAERRRRMRGLLVAHFDLEAMHRVALGRHWRRASPAQRIEFRALFEDFVVATTAVDLSRYARRSITVRVRGARGQADGGAIVDTVVARPDSPPIAILWRLRREDNKYRVAGLSIEGLSLAILLQGAIDWAVGNTGGDIAGLLDALRQRTREGR